METMISNAQNCVASSANNNTINTNNAEGLKGLIIAGHNGAKDYGRVEFGRDWCFRWGKYLVNINRCYGVWGIHIFYNYNCRGNYEANLTPDWGGKRFEGRWSKALVENMAKFILDTIADFEQEQQTEKMMEIVAEAQETIDHLVMDLQSIARTRDEIKTKMDAFAASKIVEKINDICAQCLVDCGKVCGCSMVADDGFFPNLANLDCWMSGLDPDVYLMTDVDVDFDYWLGLLDYENSDMPLGFDEEQVRFDIEGEVDDFIDLVCHYPHYLWDTMRDYISTNFHYSYCA